MVDLPYVVGAELIAAFERLGFRTATRGGALATMHRGKAGVIVPRTATLAPAVVGALLRAAEVDRLEFVGQIEAQRRGAKVSRPVADEPA